MVNPTPGFYANATASTDTFIFGSNHGLTTNHYIRIGSEIKKVSSILSLVSVQVDSNFSTTHTNETVYASDIFAEERILPEFPENRDLVDIYTFDMIFKFNKIDFNNY